MAAAPTSDSSRPATAAAPATATAAATAAFAAGFAASWGAAAAEARSAAPVAQAIGAEAHQQPIGQHDLPPGPRPPAPTRSSSRGRRRCTSTSASQGDSPSADVPQIRRQEAPPPGKASVRRITVILVPPGEAPPPRPRGAKLTLVGRALSHARPEPRGSVARVGPSNRLAIADLGGSGGSAAVAAAKASGLARADPGAAAGGARGSRCLWRRYQEVRRKLLADAAARREVGALRVGASWPAPSTWH